MIMDSSGFSLLELLMVIFISTMLVVYGINSWNDTKYRTELVNTTYELMAFLNEVKLDADIHNINYSIYLFQNNITNWCLAVSSEERPMSCQTKYTFVPRANQISINEFTLLPILTFYGRRSKAQATTIYLKNQIGESRIIVSSQGRIRYCSYHTYLAGLPRC